MRSCHYALLLAALGLVTATTGSASPKTVLRQSVASQSNKAIESADKYWNPLAGRPVANVDVPDSEPNDTPAEADPISCGDDYRPAAIDIADDIDYLVMTANAGDLVTFGTDADGVTGQLSDSVIGIFDDQGTLLASDDDSGPALYSLLLDFPIPATGTYYLAVIAYDAVSTGAYKGFVRCVLAPAPPVNDACAGALTLPCTSFSEQGTTTGAANDYTPIDVSGSGCTGFTAEGADVVYLVTLPDGGTLALDYTSVADGSVYLLDSCVSPAFAACVAGADQTYSGEAEHLSYTNTSGSGQTLYLVCDNFGTGSSGAYTLTGTVACPPVPVESTGWGLLKARFNR